jgi:hypothetical protein
MLGIESRALDCGLHPQAGNQLLTNTSSISKPSTAAENKYQNT